jgi:hypothetical protein
MQISGRRTPQLNKRLAGYTLLGAAAFTLTGKAHAGSITYVAVNQSFDGNNGPTTWNLNLSGGSDPADIEINASTFETITAGTGNGAGILLDAGGSSNAAALVFGETIDPTSGNWGTGATDVGLGLKLAGQYYVPSGDFPQDGSSAYLAFFYAANDGDHAGWIDLSTTIETDSPYDALFTINGYAYDTTPNEAITAGEGIPSAATPEPSTLSLLMLGSAGLLEVRRRRQKHA